MESKRKLGHSTMASNIGAIRGATSTGGRGHPRLKPPGKTEAMFSPDALLIGAEKSGTRSLADLLARHPGICVGTPKEPHYYSYNFRQGPAWYKRRFKNPDAPITLDTSTSYSKAPVRDPDPDPALTGIPQRVFAANSDTRILYIMRDPVARAWSNWRHRVDIGRESRAFEEALDGPNMQLLDTGDYLTQIRLWQELFPKQPFHFLTFEALLQNPLSTAAGIFAFLGLPPAPGDLSLNHLNATTKKSGIKGLFLKNLVKLPGYEKLRALLPWGFRSFVHRALSTNHCPEKIFSEDATAKIHEALAPSWDELEVLTGISTAPWRERRTAAQPEKEAAT